MGQNRIVDLHIHSYYSDGTMSPKAIVEAALARGVGYLAISDHNVLDGVRELRHFCAEYGLNYVTAVELNTLDHDNDFHILGYGIDIDNEEFCNFVKKNCALLEQVSVNLIERMQKDYDNISMPDYLGFHMTDNWEDGRHFTTFWQRVLHCV